MARIVKLIYTERHTGKGTDVDLVRLCPQLWTLDGVLIAEFDPVQEKGWFRPDHVEKSRFSHAAE